MDIIFRFMKEKKGGNGNMGRTAIVAGSTGLVGQEIVKLLIKDTSYSRIIALGRSKLKFEHSKLESILVDYAKLDTIEAYCSRADVYCALGTTIKKAGSQENFRRVDYEYPLQLAKKAKAHGAAQLLIVTAMSANKTSSIFYNRVKGEVESALQQLEMPTLQIFQPSFLLGERQEVRLGERIAGKMIAILPFLFVGKLRKYGPIHAQTVAQGMIHAAKQNLIGLHIYESNQIEELASRS